MARKVFVSYKYADTLVSNLNKKDVKYINGKFQYVPRATRVRDYVDLLQSKIGKDNINLGEKDGESLEDFSDEKIETLLKQRIRQCSITIILISKGMKTNGNESDQWIPWEISYSLRTVPTGGNTKQINAVLGIVLPDETGTYDWYYTSDHVCNCTTHNTGQLFNILKCNMFNILEKEFRECNGTKIHTKDEPSFIKTVKWEDFMNGENYNTYIDKAVEIKDEVELYDVKINLN